MIPDFSYEQYYWSRGYDLVIGIDEVGRGAFAGPIVVGAVGFERIKNKESGIKNYYEFIRSLGINDSKKVKEDEREKLAPLIKKHCHSYAIGSVGVSIINKIGIGRATMMAMRSAVLRIMNQESRIKNSNKKPKHLDSFLPIRSFAKEGFYIPNSSPRIFVLSDAFHIPYLRGIGIKNQEAIVRGDQQSISIAAASILAKVYRDRRMKSLATAYTNYGWEKNVGYGTRDHRRAILTYGQTCYHRMDFVETWKKKNKIV